jgi:hypothetical protein
MNYWFYYISLWVVMVGLFWQYRGRPSVLRFALISAPPIFAATVTIITAMIVTGGIKSGGMRLLEELVARSVDARVPGSLWYPDRKFMSHADWLNYPNFLLLRLRQSYFIQTNWFALCSALSLSLLWLRNRKAFVSIAIILAASSIWYCIMFQHTRIHQFAGQYCFMGLCAMFGLIISTTVSTVYTSINQRAGRGIAISIVLLVASSELVKFSVRSADDEIAETLSKSVQTEKIYSSTVNLICRDYGRVTVDALTKADVPLEWRPQYLAESNQLPKCH